MIKGPETGCWDRFYGNNHIRLPRPAVMRGGSVRFFRHFGKPLSPELWEDLFERLCITGLCIYRPNMGEWMLGWGAGHCIIRLDENDNVRDIDFTPFHAHLADAVEFVDGGVGLLLENVEAKQ